MLTRGWGTAAGGAVVAAGVLGVLAEGAAFAVYLAGTRRGSVLNVARAGGILFSWFHHIPVVFTVRSPASSRFPATSQRAPSFTLAVAAMLGTILAGWLLFRGGRAVGRRVGGTASVRGLHGMKVAVPYAAISLAAAFGTRLQDVRLAPPGSFRVLGTAAVSVHPAYGPAFVWPLALGLIFGFGGGFLSAGAAARPRASMGSRLRGALAGAVWMLALGMVLSFLGLLGLAAVERGATATYFRELFHRGAVRGLVFVGLNLLVLPNMAVWVFAAAMGTCLAVSAGQVSGCFLSYSHFPSGGGALRLFGVVLPSGGPVAPPAGYFTFLLVPAVAAVVGGMVAAGRGAGSGPIEGTVTTRGDGALTGALAGVVFGAFVLVASSLSTIALVVRGTEGGAGRLAFPGGSTRFLIGPRPLQAAAFSAVWGIAGGAIGGALRRPGRGNPESGTESVNATSIGLEPPRPSS
jgi:hypothetical protein